jgi:hypothetical protein
MEHARSPDRIAMLTRVNKDPEIKPWIKRLELRTITGNLRPATKQASGALGAGVGCL